MVDNAQIGAIVIATSVVVAAEIVIVTNAVAAKIAIVTATTVNRVTQPVTQPKKPAMPNPRRSKHLAATQVAVAMVPAAKAVAARVKAKGKDVAAVGMISVVASRAVTIGASVRRCPPLPLLLPLPSLHLRQHSRPQRRLRPSWAVQRPSRPSRTRSRRVPKAPLRVNARAVRGAAVAAAVAVVGVDVIERLAPPAR